MIHRTLILSSIVLLSVAFLGCPGSPPVDALQAAADAIAAASLAQDCAVEEYRAAQRLLDQANQANEAGDYDEALRLAEAAEQQAERARLTAQANADDCEAAQHMFDDDDDSVYARPDLTFADYELIPVYFDYDMASVDPRTREVLERHAQFINQNDFDVVIEGHCDHHGTDSYNLALGERRARSVGQFLVTQGVDPGRISVISYGEFRAASDHDESLNRRAEFRAR